MLFRSAKTQTCDRWREWVDVEKTLEDERREEEERRQSQTKLVLLAEPGEVCVSVLG